jgi:hypothetical protein
MGRKLTEKEAELVLAYKIRKFGARKVLRTLTKGFLSLSGSDESMMCDDYEARDYLDAESSVRLKFLRVQASTSGLWTPVQIKRLYDVVGKEES